MSKSWRNTLKNPHDQREKRNFLDSVARLSNGMSQTNILKAVELYSDFIQLPWHDEAKFQKSLDGFARCLSTSKQCNGISGEGIYTFTYASNSEEFTFQDTFPILYIFDPEHYTNESGDWISGINLTRLNYGNRRKYIELMQKNKVLKARQELTYKFITELGGKKQPFRKFNTKLMSNLRKFNDIKNVLPFDVSWTAEIEPTKK